jgi:hypothetical protein
MAQPPPSGALLPTPVGHLPEALGRKANQEFADQRLDRRRTFRRATLASAAQIDLDLKGERFLQRLPPSSTSVNVSQASVQSHSRSRQ